jgi:Putative bacterial sensory transduction regulator
MTVSDESKANPEYIKLMDILKQAISNLCDIKPNEVKVDEDGEIGYGSNGSSLVYASVYADETPSRYLFNCSILTDVKDTKLVYELVNKVNIDCTFGTIFFSPENKNIRLFYSLPVTEPTPELLEYVLTTIQSDCEDYDDRLQKFLGGEKWIEAKEDEIEV